MEGFIALASFSLAYAFIVLLGLILLLMALGVQILAQYYLFMTGAKRGEK